MKYEIDYKYFDHLIAVGSARSNGSLDVESNAIMVLKYSNYVKSQLHLNITKMLYGRSIMEYKKAYDYICGDSTYYNDALKCLQYFYIDILNFLKRNSYDVRIEIKIDIPLVSEKVYEITFNELKEDLYQFSQMKFSSFEEATKFSIEHPQLADVTDYITDNKPLADYLNTYTAILCLNQAIKESNIVEWEVPDES